MKTIPELFDLRHTLAEKYLLRFTYPWEALAGIADFVRTLGETLPETDYRRISDCVWVHKTAAIAPSAMLIGPCVIGAKTEIRHGAFLRGGVLIGDGCVVGNSVEIKNAILFDSVQVCHFNYVGDSILGDHAHMGAGSVTSNVRLDGKTVRVHSGDAIIETGLPKFGAMLGDHAEIGCNAVLNPGTIVERNTAVYPLSSVRGIVPSEHIYVSETDIRRKK